MTKKERYRYEMFHRVRTFGADNQHLFPEGSTGGQAFAIVGESVAAIEAHTTAKLTASAEVRKAKAHVRAEVREQMKAMASTARDMARDDKGMVKAFQMPARQSDQALVATARVFIESATGLKAKFVRLGLPKSFLEDLAKPVTTLEASTKARESGETKRSQAQVALDTAITTGYRAIRTLDVVVVNTFRGDPVGIAGWRKARRLQGVRTASSGVAATVPDVTTEPV